MAVSGPLEPERALSAGNLAGLAEALRDNVGLAAGAEGHALVRLREHLADRWVDGAVEPATGRFAGERPTRTGPAPA